MPSLLESPPLSPQHEIFHVERILVPEGDPPPKRRTRSSPSCQPITPSRPWRRPLPIYRSGRVDEVLLVDDGSTDRTVQVAREMGLTVIEHPRQPRLRRQSKNLLPLCPRTRRRHRRDDPSRLPVRQPSHPARRGHHRTGHLRRGARQPHSFAAKRPCTAACRFTSTSAIAS